MRKGRKEDDSQWLRRTPIAQRLANIIKAGAMEEALISANLKFLGSLQRSYLTPVEERLLSSIERIVGME